MTWLINPTILLPWLARPEVKAGRRSWWLASTMSDACAVVAGAPSLHSFAADDRLPSTRLLAMELRSAAVVIPRSAAISLSACQNGSSRLMLVLRRASGSRALFLPLQTHQRP